MELKDKYAKIIQYAQNSGVIDLAVSEQDNVLYISGKADSSVKDKMWEIYNEIDPDMRSGDLVLKIDAEEGEGEMYEVKEGDSLSKIAKNYPGLTWNMIYEVNKDVIKDPNVIYAGQKLKIPAAK